MTPTSEKNSARQQLLTLLARQSFKLGDFQLSSGGRSDYYIDCRTTTLHAEGARLTGMAILDLLHQHHLDPHAVGGLTLGADPVVSAVAIASAQRHAEKSRGRLIHGFIVRKTEKVHGTGRKIEGFCEEDAPVLIVDDVCTTGASTIAAIEAAIAAKMRVIGVVCLVERTEAKGRPAVETAAQGAPVLTLFTADDVRAEHVKYMPM
jgi:orotate phosphoribosyltransferase